MVWMVLSSFKSNTAIFRSPFALPDEIDLARWSRAWEVGQIGQYAANSAIVTVAQSTIFTRLEITDTRWALIIPYTAMGLPLAVYLIKVYLDALPEELFDAARVDGAGDVRMLWALALPLLRPGLATVVVFSALNAWNEFLLALLYIQDDSLKTIPTGLLAFSSRYQTDFGLLFSALSIITLPMIVIYVVFNRQIVDGITAGSLK
jgi:raffinose/stachyose/melibiose transport system permease protein